MMLVCVSASIPGMSATPDSGCASCVLIGAAFSFGAGWLLNLLESDQPWFPADLNLYAWTTGLSAGLALLISLVVFRPFRGCSGW